MNATTSCTIRTFCPACLPGKTQKRYQANLAAGTVVGYRNGIRISYSSVPTVSEAFVICNLSHVTCGAAQTDHDGRCEIDGKANARSRTGAFPTGGYLAVTARVPPSEHHPHGWALSRHAIPCAARPCCRSGMCCARCRARPCRTSSSS